jgi:ferredoxin
MTDGPRQTHRLVTEILTVLERHGHHAHDAQHADQAVAMIADLTAVYDGTRDVPASTGRHAAPRLYPEQARPDSLVVTGADVNAVFAALELAAEYKRHLIETCAGCDDQSCNVCRVRLDDAEAFDRLADRLLRHRMVARPADRSPLEPGGPGDSPGQTSSDGKEAGE